MDVSSPGGSHRCCQPASADELSNTLCAALKAQLRTEMELAKRDQAEAAARHEEKVQRLLLVQEQRLRMTMIQTMQKAKASATEGASPVNLGNTPVRRCNSRHRTWHSTSAGATTLSPPNLGMPHRSPKRGRGLELPIRTVRLPAGAATARSPTVVSNARSCGARSQGQRSLSPADSAQMSAPNMFASEHNRMSPSNADIEAPETPLAHGSMGMSHVMSLQSAGCSPAGALEWRHHMRRRITSHMSKSNRYNSGRRVASFLGTKLSIFNVERFESFLSGLHSERALAGRRWSERIVDSKAFEILCGACILANAVSIGLQQDVLTRIAMGDTEAHFCDMCFDMVNTFLILAFLLEITFRLFAKRCSYFFGKEWKWNVADIALAVYSVVELIVFRDYKPYFQIGRTLRLVRVVRAVRSVRMFRDLRLMICSLSQSLLSLFSALALLFVVIYLFSVCFMHAAATYVESGGQPDVMHELKLNYGDLGSTMFTLLLAISNGADWKELAAPLGKIHWGFEALFIFYVLFVVIGVLNVLTSSFVERARELSKLDRDLATQGELASQEAFLAEMRTIFEEVDDEKDGRITWQKFRDYLKSEKAQAFFATQQLDTSDAARLFSLLDVDATGAVRIEEFALGCMRLRGPAKSSDVVALLKEAKAQRKQSKELRKIGNQLDTLCTALHIPEWHCCAGSATAAGQGSAVSTCTSNRCGSARHASIAV